MFSSSLTLSALLALALTTSFLHTTAAQYYGSQQLPAPRTNTYATQQQQLQQPGQPQQSNTAAWRQYYQQQAKYKEQQQRYAQAQADYQKRLAAYNTQQAALKAMSARGGQAPRVSPTAAAQPSAAVAAAALKAASQFRQQYGNSNARPQPTAPSAAAGANNYRPQNQALNNNNNYYARNPNANPNTNNAYNNRPSYQTAGASTGQNSNTLLSLNNLANQAQQRQPQQQPQQQQQQQQYNNNYYQPQRNTGSAPGPSTGYRPPAPSGTAPSPSSSLANQYYQHQNQRQQQYNRPSASFGGGAQGGTNPNTNSNTNYYNNRPNNGGSAAGTNNNNYNNNNNNNRPNFPNNFNYAQAMAPATPAPTTTTAPAGEVEFEYETPTTTTAAPPTLTGGNQWGYYKPSVKSAVSTAPRAAKPTLSSPTQNTLLQQQQRQQQQQTPVKSTSGLSAFTSFSRNSVGERTFSANQFNTPKAAPSSALPTATAMLSSFMTGQPMVSPARSVGQNNQPVRQQNSLSTSALQNRLKSLASAIQRRPTNTESLSVNTNVNIAIPTVNTNVAVSNNNQQPTQQTQTVRQQPPTPSSPAVAATATRRTEELLSRLRSLSSKVGGTAGMPTAPVVNKPAGSTFLNNFMGNSGTSKASATSGSTSTNPKDSFIGSNRVQSQVQLQIIPGSSGASMAGYSSTGSQQYSSIPANTGSQQYSSIPANTGRQQYSSIPANTGSQQYSSIPANTGIQQYSSILANTGSQQYSSIPANTGSQQYSSIPANTGSQQYSSIPANTGSQQYSSIPANTGSQQYSSIPANTGSQQYSSIPANTGSQQYSSIPANTGSQQYSSIPTYTNINPAANNAAVAAQEAMDAQTRNQLMSTITGLLTDIQNTGATANAGRLGGVNVGAPQQNVQNQQTPNLLNTQGSSPNTLTNPNSAAPNSDTVATSVLETLINSIKKDQASVKKDADYYRQQRPFNGPYHISLPQEAPPTAPPVRVPPTTTTPRPDPFLTKYGTRHLSQTSSFTVPDYAPGQPKQDIKEAPRTVAPISLDNIKGPLTDSIFLSLQQQQQTGASTQWQNQQTPLNQDTPGGGMAGWNQQPQGFDGIPQGSGQNPNPNQNQQPSSQSAFNTNNNNNNQNQNYNNNNQFGNNPNQQQGQYSNPQQQGQFPNQQQQGQFSNPQQQGQYSNQQQQGQYSNPQQQQGQYSNQQQQGQYSNQQQQGQYSNPQQQGQYSNPQQQGQQQPPPQQQQYQQQGQQQHNYGPSQWGGQQGGAYDPTDPFSSKFDVNGLKPTIFNPQYKPKNPQGGSAGGAYSNIFGEQIPYQGAGGAQTNSLASANPMAPMGKTDYANTGPNPLQLVQYMAQSQPASPKSNNAVNPSLDLILGTLLGGLGSISKPKPVTTTPAPPNPLNGLISNRLNDFVLGPSKEHRTNNYQNIPRSKNAQYYDSVNPLAMFMGETPAPPTSTTPTPPGYDGNLFGGFIGKNVPATNSNTQKPDKQPNIYFYNYQSESAQGAGNPGSAGTGASGTSSGGSGGSNLQGALKSLGTQELSTLVQKLLGVLAVKQQTQG